MNKRVILKSYDNLHDRLGGFARFKCLKQLIHYLEYFFVLIVN